MPGPLPIGGLSSSAMLACQVEVRVVMHVEGRDREYIGPCGRPKMVPRGSVVARCPVHEPVELWNEAAAAWEAADEKW